MASASFRKRVARVFILSPLATYTLYMWIDDATGLTRFSDGPAFLASILVGVIGVWIWPRSILMRLGFTPVYIIAAAATVWAWSGMVACFVFGNCL
jgi:hypothetical protein